MNTTVVAITAFERQQRLAVRMQAQVRTVLVMIVVTTALQQVQQLCSTATAQTCCSALRLQRSCAEVLWA